MSEELDLHHELGPSAAARWMRCTASVALSRNFEDKGSEYADEGTLAHSIAADVLRKVMSTPPFDWTRHRDVSKHPAIKDLGAHNVEPLQRYVDYVLERATEAGPNALVMVENRLSLNDWIPGGFGTGDTIIYHAKRKALVVIDLKFGEGVMVFATERDGEEQQINPQLALYGLGAYALTDFLDVEEVEVVIHQPRREHVSAALVSTEDLMAFGLRVRAAVLEIEHSPQFRPSEKACQWCKVKAGCKARADWALELFGQEVALMSAGEIAAALARVDAIKAWCADIEEFAMKRIEEDPAAIPGWKRVHGRGQRTWNHLAPNILEQQLGDKAWDKKLIGITAAEKLLGTEAKRLMPSITVKSEGKPTLAPDSDPRPALSGALDGFTVEPASPQPVEPSYLD